MSAVPPRTDTPEIARGLAGTRARRRHAGRCFLWSLPALAAVLSGTWAVAGESAAERAREVAIGIWLGAWIGLAVRHAVSRCPFCGEAFHLAGFSWNPLARSCGVCGLDLHPPRGSNES